MFSFVSFIGERGYNGVGHLVDNENRVGGRSNTADLSKTWHSFFREWKNRQLCCVEIDR